MEKLQSFVCAGLGLHILTVLSAGSAFDRFGSCWGKRNVLVELGAKRNVLVELGAEILQEGKTG